MTCGGSGRQRRFRARSRPALQSAGNGCTYGFANITEPRTREPNAGRLDRLCRRFAGFGEIVQECLDALERDEQIRCGPGEIAEGSKVHIASLLERSEEHTSELQSRENLVCR